MLCNLKGEFLENDPYIKIGKMNLNSSDLIILEFKEKDKNFCFYNDQFQLPYKCDNCQKFTEIKYICGCQNVN